MCVSQERTAGPAPGGCNCFIPKGFAGAASDTLYYFPKRSLYFEILFTVWALCRPPGGKKTVLYPAAKLPPPELPSG